MNSNINEEILGFKSKLKDSFDGLRQLSDRIANQEIIDLTDEITKALSEPFLFVIVGEVKSGKSSFINALLESKEEICAVAPSPMTDTIQQIVFGEEKTEFINPFLKKLYRPFEILKDINIVDTPGTNTIVDHHQEITERFIPSSDLVVFVFEAKNPYRQSAWTFFDFIHDSWRKKIIFVLQQKDLMNEEDLAINLKGVQDFALKKGISDPKVFPVSAKMELEEKKDLSGFVDLREYIINNITGGKAPYLKLISTINSGNQIINRIENGIKDRKNQLEYDLKFREDISGTLDQQEGKTAQKVASLEGNLLNAYDKCTLSTINTLSEGLSILPLFRRSFSALFGSQKNLKNWLKDVQGQLEKDLNIHLKDKLQEGVVEIAESIQDMGKIIDLKIRASKTVLQDNHDIFSDIAERRANVLKELQQSFSNFLSRSENFYEDNLIDRKSLAPNVATGGGIAVVGVILTAVTNLAVFDITGGILAAIGLTFAGVSVGFNRRRILKKVREEMGEGRIRIENEVSEKLLNYVNKIKQKIDQNFDQFDLLLQNEKKEIAELDSNKTEILTSLQNIEKEIQDSLLKLK